MKYAECHTDRKHCAKGLCRSCYNQQNFKAQGKKYKNYHSYDKYRPYYENNKEKLKAAAKENYNKNRSEALARVKKYTEANKDKIREYKKQYRAKNKDKIQQWIERNRNVKNYHTATRRAEKQQATPKWLTETHLEQIGIFYEAAHSLSRELNIKFHVDHIIPLKGKHICGLHVPWNLQVLEATENLKKHNKA